MFINIRIYLIYLILIEIVVGGSGQVFLINGVPLRQILFFIFLFFYFFDLLIKNLKLIINFDFLIVTLILTYSMVSVLIGLLHGNNELIIFSDISPMLYFLIYFPLLSYTDKYQIGFSTILNILHSSSFFVSIMLILTYYVLFTYFDGDIVLFRKVIEEGYGREIFWFRKDGWIFYPGLIYVLISIIFIFKDFIVNGTLLKRYIVVYFLGVIALFLSMTKGLIFILILSHLLIIFKYKKSIKTILILSFITLLFLIVSLNYLNMERLFEFSNEKGSSIRIITLIESADKFMESILFGNGFGTELSLKKLHQENSFLDILVEQGIIGLLLYVLVSVKIFIQRKNNYVLYISFLMIMLLSLTNPYVNNPLGITIIIIALIFTNKMKATKAYL